MLNYRLYVRGNSSTWIIATSKFQVCFPSSANLIALLKLASFDKLSEWRDYGRRRRQRWSALRSYARAGSSRSKTFDDGFQSSLRPPQHRRSAGWDFGILKCSWPAQNNARSNLWSVSSSTCFGNTTPKNCLCVGRETWAERIILGWHSRALLSLNTG